MKLEKSRFNSEAAPQPIPSQKAIFTADESDISVIKFEGVTVRIVNVYGDPWFVASDVCQSLEISKIVEMMKGREFSPFFLGTRVNEVSEACFFECFGFIVNTKTVNDGAGSFVHPTDLNFRAFSAELNDHLIQSADGCDVPEMGM